jgi:two-component sensor histidine kinase
MNLAVRGAIGGDIGAAAAPRLERVARIARATAKASLVAVVLCDEAGSVQAAGEPWPLALTFAAGRAECPKALVTGDLAGDPDAADLAADADGVRFFVGLPLCAGLDHAIGFLCIGDPSPRAGLTADERSALEDLASMAADMASIDREDDRRETLVAELDHRIKNVLAAVQSLALQSARRAASLDGFLKTFTGRLKAMASAHALLTATRWRGADIRNIAAAELGGLAPGQTRWEGPDLLLTARAANALSLALHELATNAIKFGALSVDGGRVDVRWRERAGGGLELEWVESDGPVVPTPTRTGFGSTLLEKVTGRELGGSVRIDFKREGVRAVLTASAAALAHRAGPPDAQPKAEPAAAVQGESVGAANLDQAPRITGLRLLIVEDALLLTLELESGLQEAGAQIMGSAADLDEAMRMVDLPIDAAVLDANLNGVSVLPVAEALRARGVPFVFATGYGDSKMAPQGFGAPIIRKPYDVTQVAAALAEITRKV